MVSTTHMMDSSFWTNGENYDGYRFYNLRRASTTGHSFEFSTTSPNHIGFGHGNQACPGRFFATTMIKIILCHVLLKYDINVVEPVEGRTKSLGVSLTMRADVMVNLKRRTEEILI